MTDPRLRPLTEDDAERVSELFVAALGEPRRLDAEEVRSWARNVAMPPESLMVLEVDGRVVGYGDMLVRDDDVTLDLAAPGWWDTFLDWGERTATEKGRCRVKVYVPPDHELADVVAERGYRLWRSSYDMQMALVDPTPPVFPEGIELRPFDADKHADAVRVALNEAFAEDPTHHDETTETFDGFFLKGRGFDESLWFVVWDGDEIAGFALCSAGHLGDDELGWVGDLGVRPPWRRRGLAEALLRTAFVELHRRGLSRVGLGVDAENVAGALRLYERVGLAVKTRGDNWMLEI